VSFHSCNERGSITGAMLYHENNFSKNLTLGKRIVFRSYSCANIFKNSTSDNFEISIDFGYFITETYNCANNFKNVTMF